ncbi:phage tail assembly protein [Novosphingobium colocasiae]|uniref:phage tail assembly protein n=1 Tax=Novosphingobium colocasiae TaxID=1256513 RepID=UPI0035B13FCE
MSRIFATHSLKYPLVRETRDAEGNEREEELKPAGFSVILRRPRGKDMRIMDRFEGQEIGGSIALIARISNLTEEETELLDAEDLGELGNVLGGSAAAGRGIGLTA